VGKTRRQSSSRKSFIIGDFIIFNIGLVRRNDFESFEAAGFDANEGNYVDQRRMCPIEERKLVKHFDFRSLQ
jgi:hypothetical protein